MGTNYYLEYAHCETCGKPNKVLHLGRLSAGWKFLIHKHEDITNYEELKQKIKQGVIKDEYNTIYSQEEFLKIIEDSQKEKHHDYHGTFASENIGGYDFQEMDFS